MGAMQAGDQVGKYEVVTLVGEGGFAAVWRVRHLLLGSTHALKVLHDDLLGLEEVRQRFLDEARVQAQLQHPGIVRVTDLIAEPGVAGFVMEYVDGRSLGDEIELRQAAGNDRPAPAHIREVFVPVMAAVGFAHSRGVVHRDLKPDNILLATDSTGQLTPKVADFGIAKVAGELKGSRKTTLGSRTLGTLGYMSPEQVVSSRDVDGRSDVFSLGICLLEYATLVSPFDRDSEFQTMKAIHEVDYVIPDALRASDPGLVAVVERALRLDPGERFPDVAAMAEALATDGVARQQQSRAPSRPPPSREPVAVPPRKAKETSLTQFLGPVTESPVTSPPVTIVVQQAQLPAPLPADQQVEKPTSDNPSRIGRGCLGAAVGFFLGAPAGGFGAVPGAIFGFLLAAYLPEVAGCLFASVLFGVLAWLLSAGC